MNLQQTIRRILREDSRVYDYDPDRNTVPFDERLTFDVDKLLRVGAVFITPAIDGDPKSKTYKKWLDEPYVHLITLKNVIETEPDSWIHKAISKKGNPESYRKDFVYKFYDGKYNQILWSLEKLGIDPNEMIEDKDNSIKETIIRVLKETREEKIKNFIYSKFDIVFDELDLVIIYDQRFTTTMYGKWYNKENDEEVFHRNDWGILWIGKCGPYRKLRTYSKAVGLDFEGFEKVLIEYLNDKYKEQFNNKPVKSVGDEHFCLEDED